MRHIETLSSKFIIGFILIIVIPVIIINSSLYYYLKEQYKIEYSDKTIKSMEYLSNAIESELKRLRLKTAMMVSDDKIIKLIDEWNAEKDIVLKRELEYELEKYISKRFDYLYEIDSAYFFMKDSGYYSYKEEGNINESKIRKEKWYLELTNKFQLKTIKNNDKNKFSIAAGISHLELNTLLNLPENLEMLLVNYKTYVFDGIHSELGDKYRGDVIIFDDYGNVMVSSKDSNLGKNINDFPDLKEVYLENKEPSDAYKIDNNTKVISYKTPQSGWLIVNITDYNIMMKEMEKNILLFNKIFGLMILLFMLFSIVFFNKIIRAIRRLMKRMKKAEKGYFVADEKLIGFGEIKELEIAFTEMINKIDDLMIERDKKEKERQEEEIRALQAQINPHFIYNTLNCIKLMAMMAHKENIENMVYAFMELLGGMFKDSKMMITVENEIEYTKHYIHIMQVRYADSFDVTWDIDNSILNCLTLKLMLQPIIENAITHGISHNEERGLITIKGYKNDDEIVFKVTDNGQGILPEKIKLLFMENDTGTEKKPKVGIYNVNKRIKLNFGEEYGIYVESELNKYTQVTVRVPIIEE
ncbi:sensor histidine kinase [Vallitalea maricola]|uniref:Sensor histidine kinase n=1 Tax=Vallitalea maricola TaxID=3074433 RepID=A0ACB5UNM4_9FIRM|nr:sensor histidine kinase [Vallitalea sp. AN17-2]